VVQERLARPAVRGTEGAAGGRIGHGAQGLGRPGGGRPLAYNTVQTVLNILYRKGRVRRERKGRAYHYQPAVTRLQAARQAVGDLVARLFDGSPERLVMSLVESKQLTPEALARLSEIVERGEEASAGEP
jgi:predicted transcriptional regulator